MSRPHALILPRSRLAPNRHKTIAMRTLHCSPHTSCCVPILHGPGFNQRLSLQVSAAAFPDIPRDGDLGRKRLWGGSYKHCERGKIASGRVGNML